MSARGPKARDLFGREDLPERASSQWRFLVPGRRMRVGSAAVVLVGFVGTLLLLAAFVLPNILVDRPRALDALRGVDRVQQELALDQARNAVRNTMVQAVGGLVVLLTFGVGFGQLMVARRGQLVDRFTKTIEQLGESIDVRIGAIYALQQIAERPEYARPVAETLLAYLKTNAAEGVGASQRDEDEAGSRSVLSSDVTGHRVRLRPDLQAALRVLVVDGLWKRATSSRLDLSFITVRYADLSRVDLSGAVLLGAILDGSNLRGANLSTADLRRAGFAGADLRTADLTGADLSGAQLTGARLDNARLHDSLLVNANLTQASLKQSDLSFADASYATFSHASLNAAKLDGSVLIGASLDSSDLSGATMLDSRFDERTDFTHAKQDDAVVHEGTRGSTEPPPPTAHA
jgi:uncharacterized protein YjbI with pentapeptide repeats